MYSPRPNTPARNKPTHMYTHAQASLSFPPGNESYSALYYVPFLVFRSLPPSFSLSFHVYGSTAAHGEYIHIYVGECVYISAARRVSTLYICTYVRIYVYIHRNACTRGCAEERECTRVPIHYMCVHTQAGAFRNPLCCAATTTTTTGFDAPGTLYDRLLLPNVGARRNAALPRTFLKCTCI